jgi:hypothetical protein
MRVIQTQNPTFSVNVTLDAKILTFLKRIIPVRLFGLFNYWLFSSLSQWGHFSKANPQRQSAVARLTLVSQFKRMNRALRL